MVHSYSKWLTWYQCAAKYNYSYNLKLPRTPIGPAGQRGTDIHESVDNYILGKADRMHQDIHKKWGMYVEMLKSYDCFPEEEWAVDKKWLPVPFNHSKAWVRGKFDLRIQAPDLLEIKEWKTGKVYDEHAYQKHLYGTVALVLFPAYNSVTVAGIYFDQKQQPPPEEHSRADLPMMKITWKDRFTRLEKDKDFNPNPTFMCRYCDYSAAKNGPCRF